MAEWLLTLIAVASGVVALVLGWLHRCNQPNTSATTPEATAINVSNHSAMCPARKPIPTAAKADGMKAHKAQ